MVRGQPARRTAPRPARLWRPALAQPDWFLPGHLRSPARFSRVRGKEWTTRRAGPI